jgi:transposase
MNKPTRIGLDLAKDVFQVHAVDQTGAVVTRRQLRRGQVLAYFANLEPCLVGMEACGGMHYWARQIEAFGHTVRPMAAKFIKPYVKSNKSDALDAEAICEAVSRPNMRFVSPKSPEQQALQHLHRSRQLLVRQQTALSNHVRATLMEFGLVVPKGLDTLRQRLAGFLEDGDNALPMLTREVLATLAEQLKALSERIAALEKQLKRAHASNQTSRNLADMRGVGLLGATALASVLGNGTAFRNGREFAAWLGLVPRQASTGGRERLLGISKRGDTYIRTLLVHGARAVLRHVRRRLAAGSRTEDPWLVGLLQRAHPNVVAVALANHNARVAWAMVRRNQPYRHKA